MRLTGEVRVVVEAGEQVLPDGSVRVSRQQRHHVVMSLVAPLHYQRKVRRVSAVVGCASGRLVLVRAGDTVSFMRRFVKEKQGINT